jgi:hypothetical protein
MASGITVAAKSANAHVNAANDAHQIRVTLRT